MKEKIKKTNWFPMFVVLLCIASDLICILEFSVKIYNETPLISWLVSVVLAVCLDASLAYAASIFSQSKKKLGSKEKLAAAAMLLVFFLAFISLVLIAVAASYQSESTDLFQNGTIARLIIPIATSILSFVLGWDLDPNKTRLEELKRQRSNIQMDLLEEKATCQRLYAAFQRMDPEAYDVQMFRLSMSRLKAALTQAQYKLRIALAEELGTTEAANMLKDDDLLLDAGDMIKKLEQFGEDVSIAPTEKYRSGRVP